MRASLLTCVTPAASWGPDCSPETSHPLLGCTTSSQHMPLSEEGEAVSHARGRTVSPLIRAVWTSGFWWNKAAYAHRWGLVFFLSGKCKGRDTKSGMAAHNRVDWWKSHLPSPRFPFQWSSGLSHSKPLFSEWCWSNWPWKWLWDKGVLPLQIFILFWMNGLCKIEQTSLTGLQPVFILKLSSKTERMRTFLFL